MLSMQDISNWQGPKAPENVASNEILAIKATEGTGFQDPDFPNNWTFAKEHEKARLAYHYLHPSLPALSQARYFLDYVDNHGIETGDLFAVDVEVTDGRTPEEVDAVVKAFVEEVNGQTKGSCWVYSNLFTIKAGNLASMGDSPLWIADPSSPPGRPAVPEPWKVWTAHQYGVVKGIDADVVNVEGLDQLAKLGAMIKSAEPPEHIVTVLLTAEGGQTKSEEFNQTTQLMQMRGKNLAIGGASVEFK